MGISMIVKQKDKPIKEAMGVKFQTLATGEKIMCTIMRLEKDKKIPRHQHPAEQVGFVIKGKFKLSINDEEAGTLTPGDSYVIKSNEPHAFETIEDSEWVDTFSPPREEYRD